ncbi:hypothetical protein GCM10022393_12920 [Aquimarina addita]|uniref:Peptidase M28 domain-containing protein n=1 Tax=Aquimarina addita TaxID=870485 RepID=A0ABP7XF89_9FLAO
MKHIFLIAISILFINFKQPVAAQQNKKMGVPDEAGVYPKGTITKADVEEVVTFLASDALEGRDTGSKGLKKAAEFVEAKFSEYGVIPYFDSYLNTFDAKGTETFNVIGYLKGTDPVLSSELIVIGAHLDHIGTATPVNGDVIANGANDNAAGSAAVILLAKHFASLKSNKRSILFILFGAEEKGLLGSKHIAKVLKEKNVNLYTMVNFEMIGVPLQDKSYKAYITGYEKSNMAEKMNAYAGSKLIGFLPKAKEFQLFTRSDNYSFFKEFQIPAQTISTFDFTNYDYYHHVDDESSEMNFEFMSELINECVPVITSMSNTEIKEIKLN